MCDILMKQISSRENSDFRLLKRLVESSRERRKTGKTLLDGSHLLEASLASGIVPEMVVVSSSGAENPEVMDILSRLESVRLLQLSDTLFAEISPVDTPTGVLAVIAIPENTHLNNPEFCLLLEDIQDPGNLGSILRTAAAAGVQGVYLSTACADAWSPKVLRAGMGAHFALMIIERANLIEVASSFKGVVLATDLSANKDFFEVDLAGAVAVMFGNEGAGLSQALKKAASHAVRITMPGKMESLNVAATAAICLFERVRQQWGKV